MRLVTTVETILLVAQGSHPLLQVLGITVETILLMANILMNMQTYAEDQDDEVNERIRKSGPICSRSKL